MVQEQDTTEKLHRHLVEKGHRVTSQRRTIFEALVRQADGFTVEELHREVKTAGRATLYRTIRLLVRMGVLCKLAMQDGRPRYSLAQAVHHHHAICLTCGVVTDIYRCGVDNLLENVQIATGSQVLGHRLEVYVLCPSCTEASPVA